MPYSSGRPTKHTVFTNTYATGNTGTPAYHRVFSNLTVVTNLYLVIYLYTLTNYRILKCSSIDCRAGSYLYVITYQHAPQLINLNVLFFIKSEAKTISANHCTRMNYNRFTYFYLMINRNVVI